VLAAHDPRESAVTIVDVRERSPLSAPIRNADIDVSRMTLSLVALTTDEERDGRPVVGDALHSNGRYGQGPLPVPAVRRRPGRRRGRGRAHDAVPDLPGIGFEGQADPKADPIRERRGLSD
jgi:hypothetical protein